MKKSFVLLMIFFTLSGITQAQIPQTISYQGVLTDSNGELITSSGLRLTFQFYSTAEGGEPLWKEIHDSVPVENGLFSAILGSRTRLRLPFDQPYFLGITVNNGRELLPRIELTATAYSLNSRAVADSAITGKSIARGSLVRSLNGLTDAVTLKAGDNISLTVEGQNVTISAGAQGSQSRNTLDAADGNPVAAVLVDDTGNVGIGSATPATRLHVEGGSDAKASGGGFVAIGAIGAKNIVLDNNEIMARDNGGASPLFLNADSGAIILGKSDSSAVGLGTSTPTERLHLNTVSGSDMKILFSEEDKRAVSLFYEGSAGTGTDNRLHIRSELGGAESNLMTWKLDGKVGIGTEAPGQKLSVSGTVESLSGGFKFPDGTVQITAAGSGGDGHSLDAADGSPTDVVFVSNSGKVGIGTKNPGAKLDIAGDVRWQPVTRYVSLHPSAFRRRKDTDDPVEITSTLGLRAIPNTLDRVTFAFVHAPVNLPDGAVVTSFQYIYVDQLQIFDTTAKLLRKHLTDALTTTMASATSSSYSDHIRTKTDNTIVDAVIDNSQYVYSVYVELETHSIPSVSALYLTAIRIEYTMDRPH